MDLGSKRNNNHHHNSLTGNSTTRTISKYGVSPSIRLPGDLQSYFVPPPGHEKIPASNSSATTTTIGPSRFEDNQKHSGAASGSADSGSGASGGGVNSGGVASGAGGRRQMFKTTATTTLQESAKKLIQQQVTRGSTRQHEDWFDSLDLQNNNRFYESFDTHASSAPCCLYSNSNSFILGNCIRESKKFLFPPPQPELLQQQQFHCFNRDDPQLVLPENTSVLEDTSTINCASTSATTTTTNSVWTGKHDWPTVFKTDTTTTLCCGGGGGRTDFPPADATDSRLSPSHIGTPGSSGYLRPSTTSNTVKMHLARSPGNRSFFSSKVRDTEDNNNNSAFIKNMTSFERFSLMESSSHQKTTTTTTTTTTTASHLIPPGMSAMREMLTTAPLPNPSSTTSLKEDILHSHSQNIVVAPPIYGLTDCPKQHQQQQQQQQQQQLITVDQKLTTTSQRNLRVVSNLLDHTPHEYKQTSFMNGYLKQHQENSTLDLDLLLRLRKCTTDTEHHHRQLQGLPSSDGVFEDSTATGQSESTILPSFMHNNAFVSSNQDSNFISDCSVTTQQTVDQFRTSAPAYRPSNNSNLLLYLGSKPEIPLDFRPNKLSLLYTNRIIDVWAHNLESEFTKIRDIVEKYRYVAVDTEFPGVVALPTAACSEYHYKTIKYNVDLLKVIQLGITFANEQGATPDGISTWQFNFKFDLKKDMYAENSINFLQENGINFQMHQNDGIDIHEFGEMIMSSGLVMNKEVKWISFHGSYDFGYLMKLLTCAPLPESEQEFFSLLRDYFPSLYDIKYLLKNCKELTSSSSLQKIAEHFKVTRVGPQHQAGSDSLVTCKTFFRLIETCFSNLIDDSVFSGVIYGLGNKFYHQAIEGVSSSTSSYYAHRVSTSSEIDTKEAVAIFGNVQSSTASRTSPTLISSKRNFLFRGSNQSNAQATGVDSLLCSQDVPMLVVGIGNTNDTAVLS